MSEHADIIEAATKPGGSLRSPVFRYLWSHYSVLSKLPLGVNCEELAVLFAAKGIMDRNGRPPSKRVVADTWRNVCRLKQHGPKKRKKPEPKSAMRRCFSRAARKR